jgi:hypothetical protein
MFSALRQGNIIYILDKRGVPTLKIGQVTSVSEPRAKYNTSFPSQPFSMETTVDIMAKAGEESYEFKQLASQASVSSYEGVVVSESRDAINAEIEAIQQISRKHIADTPYHEKVDEACEELKKELNPNFAKEKAQEEKIDALENKMIGIEGTLDNIKSMLSNALNANKKGE